MIPTTSQLMMIWIWYVGLKIFWTQFWLGICIFAQLANFLELTFAYNYRLKSMGTIFTKMTTRNFFGTKKLWQKTVTARVTNSSKTENHPASIFRSSQTTGFSALGRQRERERDRERERERERERGSQVVRILEYTDGKSESRNTAMLEWVLEQSREKEDAL